MPDSLRSSPVPDEILFEVVPSDEGGFEARALGFDIFTEADTLPELRDRIRDAVRCHFEPGVAPRVIRLHHVHDEVMPA